MKYLDYNRLCDDVDPVLRTFLLSLYHTDTMRRAKIAFPEFFTDNEPGQSEVAMADIVTRYNALATEDSEFNPEMTELAEAVVLWFGIPLYVHEQREDRIPPKDGNNLLPVNFILERGEDYNGFTDKPWIVELSVHGMRKQPHLVLDILMTGSVGKDNPSFFIWTVPTMFIEFF